VYRYYGTIATGDALAVGAEPKRASKLLSKDFYRALFWIPDNCPMGKLRMRREASADIRTDDPQHSE
jgi:hypothetical protein